MSEIAEQSNQSKIAYSEIFLSIQGEGAYTGRLTSWVRYTVCNLVCSGFLQKDPTDPSTYELPFQDFDVTSVNRIEDLPVWTKGCDSSYTWAAKFKKLWYRDTAAGICDKLQEVMSNEFNPNGTFLHPNSGEESHLCFTGGEPLLRINQFATMDILNELRLRNGGPIKSGSSVFVKASNMPEFITFETNGTQNLTPEFVEFFSNRGKYAGELFWSVSPKLWTVSGEKSEKAIKPEVVLEYQKLSPKGQLKFVVGNEPRQWEELDATVKKFREAGVNFPVWVMPVAATKEDQLEGAGEIASMAIERGYHVSARVHCYLWANVLGV